MSRDTPQVSFDKSQVPFSPSCVFVGTRRMLFITQELSSGLGQIPADISYVSCDTGRKLTSTPQIPFDMRRRSDDTSRMLFDRRRGPDDNSQVSTDIRRGSIDICKMLDEIVRLPFIPGFSGPLPTIAICVESYFNSSLRSLCGLCVSAVSFSWLGFTAETQRTRR
jgi:hypothetical protein